MNIHSAFARTTTIEIGRKRNNRRRNFNAIINSGHQNSMTAATTTTGDSNPVGICVF
jgi:hypothetical protein